jgi:uncharacterized cupredoxin-like copper-binding protein
MRHGRFITTALVATAAMAIGPAWAAAAPAPFVDDVPADFSAGTPGTATSTTDAPGSVRLARTMKTEQFDAGLPASLAPTQWTPPAGTASVSGGMLTVDGARVSDVRDYVPGQTLEFRATFSNAASEHVGFGKTLEAGPWAIFSTGGGGALANLQVSTQPVLNASETTPVPAMVDAIPGVDKTIPHTYRIEWSATKVEYFVDGVSKVTHNLTTNTFTDQLHPVVSDFTADSSSVSVDSLGMNLFANSGAFESRVFNAGDARGVWGTLSSTGSASGIAFETRSGKTANPNDGSWSGYQHVGAGGAIQSPAGQYIQYRATLTTADDRVTPSLDSVTISYDVDTVGPSVAADSAQVSGTTARLAFSSPDSDVAGFQCSLDGGAFIACTSPKEYSGLSAGSHTASVRGVDRVGNIGTAAAKTFTIASSQSGGGQTGGGGSSAVDKTAPKVTLVAKSLKASKKGTVSFTVGCPATEATCKVTLKLKKGAKTVASKTVTVKGGKTKTVTLQLNKATRQQLKHRSLKLTSVLSASDAAGNKRTTSKKVTLHKS